MNHPMIAMLIFDWYSTSQLNPGDLLRHINFFDTRNMLKLGEPACLTQTPQKELIVRFSRPGSGEFEMVLDGELKGFNADLGLGEKQVSSFEIPKRFCILNVQAERPDFDETATVYLYFSHKLNVEQKLPELIIEPNVDNVSVYRSDYSLVVKGKFKAGKNYNITVPASLLSEDNETLKQNNSIQVLIPEYQPEFQFTYNEGILSPSGNIQLDVKAVNVEGLKLEAWRVHANNIVYHIRDKYYSEATSRMVLTKDIKLNMPSNKPQSMVLDLKGLLPESSGIYRINAKVENSMWTRDSSLVTITDLALTAKSGRDCSLVWVTSLRTGEPVPGVEVKALTFNNQVLSTEMTDANGLARLTFTNSRPDGDVWLITAEKNGDLSYIRPDDNRWVIDDVPQSGRPFARNYEVMLYTERGVYRPGETMHITGIMRGRTGDTPPPFSLSFKISRPDGKQVADLIAKPMQTDQGVFQVDFPTRSDCQTGQYNIRVTLPGSDENLGSEQTLVECFVPVRMEVKAKTTSERYGPNEPPSVNVTGRYLWDEPASETPAVITGTLRKIRYSSKEYPDYRFGDKLKYETITLPDSAKELDKEGAAQIDVNLPKSLEAGLYRMMLSAAVTETGGRSVSANTNAILDTLDRHIGINLPSGQVISINKPVQVNWVRLSGEDKLISEGQLKQQLARVEYDTVLKLVNDRRVWNSSERTIPVGEENTINDPCDKGSFEVTCTDPGNYRIIITDVKSNTRSSLDFYVSARSDGPQSVPMNQPERLQIITDKEKYLPGQTAKVLIRSPIAGRFLLTVEDDSVVSEYFGTIENNTAELDVPLSKELRGSVYLSAAVVRAIDPNLENWLPHRAMGETRLLLDNTEKIIPVTITAPDKAEPNETISVKVDTGVPSDVNCPALVHLWAVDEGVLSTTTYQTPDPFDFFMGPRRLGVSTSDIFTDLLPDNKRPSQITRIGAGNHEAGSLRRNPVPAKYREAAVIWQKAMPVDANGQLVANIKLPDLNGQMRFMAVVVDKDRYAKAEHDMTLTSPIIAEASWPRFVAPWDQFEVPVKLFNSTDKTVSVQLKVSLTGPVEIVPDESIDKVILNPGKPTVIMLKVKAENKMGVVEAKVDVTEIEAAEKPLTAQNIANFSVRPAAALHSIIEIHSVKAGEKLTIEPPQSFIDGTAEMTVSISARPNVQLGPALEELIRYPYGCVEQTSSKLFSLLYASDILGKGRSETIDEMVNAGITRLWSMQTRSGGLSYWPGDSTPCLWGTAYAASCLLEAKNAGYKIDPQFISELTKYLEQQLKTDSYESPDLNTKALICRVLAVFGDPPYGWMAQALEQKDKLDVAGQAHLAAAFYAAGKNDNAMALLPQQLPQNFGTTTTSGRFTSAITQQAVLLSVLLEVDPNNPVAAVLARKINDARNKSQWGSTLNNAAVIAALSRYQVMTSKDEPNFAGDISLAGQDVAKFDSNSVAGILPAYYFKQGQDALDTVTITSSGNGTIYVVVLSEGLAKKGLIKPFDNGLHIERTWTDRHGNPIDVNNLKVGDLVQVKLTIKTMNQNVDNIAIVDALPGGMEIENPRLATSSTQSYNGRTDNPDHVEFLDDRVILFCSANKNERFFRYSLRVTTAGIFDLPPIQASCMYEAGIACLGPEGSVIIKGN